MPSKNLVLRTMYIDPDVDDKLRTEAFDSRTSKNDLLRKYLRLGMEAAAKGASFEVVSKRAATRPVDHVLATNVAAKRAPAVVASKKSAPAKKSASLPAAKTVAGASAGRKKPAAKPAAAQG